MLVAVLKCSLCILYVKIHTVIQELNAHMTVVSAGYV